MYEEQELGCVADIVIKVISSAIAALIVALISLALQVDLSYEDYNKNMNRMCQDVSGERCDAYAESMWRYKDKVIACADEKNIKIKSRLSDQYYYFMEICVSNLKLSYDVWLSKH